MTSLETTEAKAALDALASVLPPAGAIYVCGPLDHGRLYYEAKARSEDGAQVRSANQAALTAFAERLRSVQSKPVVDPGILRVEGWNGRSYGEFFLEVIRRFVCEAWFIDGWVYSHGATKEFLLCQELGIPTRDADGELLSVEVARSTISDAADHLVRLGVDDGKLRERLASLALVSSSR